jgi:stringent starvation protein B
MQREVIMVSVQPYILRAVYQWICDINLTPQLIVCTDHHEVVVPKEYIKNNQIVLNISPTAVRDLVLGDEYVLFSARFSGRFREVIIPLSSVLSIYARESNQGLSLAQFDMEEASDDSEKSLRENIKPNLEELKAQPKVKAKPSLTIVK